jgi:hypothetical protein
MLARAPSICDLGLSQLGIDIATLAFMAYEGELDHDLICFDANHWFTHGITYY